MRLFYQKMVVLCILCLSSILLYSCVQPPIKKEVMRILVSPQKLSVHSGSEDPVFVRLLDVQGGPLFGMQISAVSTAPAVATITSEAVTDVGGKATFTVKGISPGSTIMIFSVAGQKASMEVVFIEH